MSRFLVLAALPAVLITLTGCPYCAVSLTPAPAHAASALGPIEGMQVRDTVTVDIDSYLLFGCLPLLTGNSYRANSSTYKKFSDQATLKDAERVFYQWADLSNADRAVVLRKYARSSGWWSLWLLWHKTATLEGEYLVYSEKND